ncbi:MAG: response regulator [Pyrinomonadaceae bacterium]
MADDSVTIQKVVNLTFADEGIEVISVGDGNSAMEKFVETSPDLVMVDVNMPGLDGYRICEMIKQDEETKQVPVILLVGSFEPFDEEEARRVGANDFLTKPFQSIRQLVNKVTVLLNSSAESQAPAPEPVLEVEAQPPVVQEAPAEPETQKIAPAEEVAPEPETAETATFDPLGDAGMDDEMIQANQVGSFSIDETRRFESGESVPTAEEPQTEVETTEEFQAEEEETVQEPEAQEEAVPTETGEAGVEDFGKTQPFTAEEMREFTGEPAPVAEAEPEESAPVAEAGPEESAPSQPEAPVEEDQDVSPPVEDERVAFLEERMISEFESESAETSAEEAEAPKLASVDDYFSSSQASEPAPEPAPEPTPEPVPVEMAEEEPYQVEEVPEEKGFAIDEPMTEPEAVPEAEAGDYRSATEEESTARDFYDQTGDVDVQEISVEPETAPLESFVETADSEETAPEAGESAVEEETGDQPTWEGTAEAEPFEAVAEEEASPEPVAEQSEPVAEQSDWGGEQSYPYEEYVRSEDPWSAPVEEAETVSEEETTRAFDGVAEPAESAQTDQAVESEEIAQEYQPEEVTEEYQPEEPTEEAQTVEVMEPSEAAEPVETADESFEGEGEPVSVVQEAPPVEEEEDEPVAVVEESTGVESETPVELNQMTEEEDQAETVPGIELGEEPLEIAPEEDSVHSKVNALVSNKDKTEAVESVIVSEFARQSISLSSEAVETIASRIAERISEKIIQEMASEVVSDLADLIVEKMERKRRSEEE